VKRWAWVALLLGILGVLTYSVRPGKRRDGTGLAATHEAASRRTTRRPWNVSVVARDSVEPLQRLEAERGRADATEWAAEIRAQDHEEVFVTLWDALRAAPDPWIPLESFDFDEIRMAAETSSESLDLGIAEGRLEGEEKRWTRREALEAMGRWRREGWKLVQSEFRHRRYFERSDGGRSSVFHVVLHLRRNSPAERLSVTTELDVEWRNPRNPGEAPYPARLGAREVVMRRRAESGWFVRQLSRPLVPEAGLPFVDPLIVHDLDGNGSPEIVLGCKNEVFWNRGGGKFERGRMAGQLQDPLLAMVVCDATADGRPDLLGADHDGLVLVAGSAAGRLDGPPRRVWAAPARLENPIVMAVGDVDGDGDLDVWLAQYKVPYVGGQMPTPYFDANDGFPGYLLRQQTDGSFQDSTAECGLERKRHRRAYSAVFSDLDDDGDLDLSVVSDFAGLDVFQNDGKGHFSDVTETRFGRSRAFGMGQTLADLNGDGRLDLLMIGMNSFTGQRLDGLGLGPAALADYQRQRGAMAHGNRLYLARADRHEEVEAGRELVETGWSWGVTTADFDNDGDLDVYIVNGHKSRGTVRDYERQFWRHDIYVGTSGLDPVGELYFQTTAGRLYGAGWSYGGFEKNRLLLAQGGGRYAEAGWLLDVGFEDDFRNVAGADLDGDGRVDLVATTFGNWPEGRQGFHVFRNEINTTHHWIGFRLHDGGGGRTAIGASVKLWSGGRMQRRWIVAGDSYRSQHPAVAHFGLGNVGTVERAEIRWPNGSVQVLAAPGADRYHDVR